MSSRELLSPQLRAKLFDPPCDAEQIVRHYTFAADDLRHIAARRLPHNRLGFAVQLAYLRYPGRALMIGETPSSAMLDYIIHQLGFAADLFSVYPMISSPMSPRLVGSISASPAITYGMRLGR